MFRYRIMYRYCSYRYDPGTIEKCGIMRKGLGMYRCCGILEATMFRSAIQSTESGAVHSTRKTVF
jgi:hypothetical protein